ncbi:integrin alpha-4-like [Saccostrea cucullata]|uniref:integrin alpha-4-like n=1 Tax=Saccostrea cuccullata TaxID=36930 RepID=UPI002ED58F78
MTSVREFFGIFQTFHVIIFSIHGYFVDVKNFTVYSGPHGSLFGYSVALLNNSDGFWILVGAPEGDDIFQPWVRQPGALYKCPYLAEYGGICQQVNVDSSGNSEETYLFHRKKIRFHNDKNHQWLGVALDVDPENHSSILICAHRWKDSYLNLHLNGITHMNGMCYQLDSSLSKTARKIPALTIRERLVNRQRYAEFSMGGLGMSAIYSGVSGYLILGAPGLNDWSGGVVLERNGSNKDDLHYIEPPRGTYQDFQIGSSLAVGNFLFRTLKSLALGAPRAGKVLFYEWMDRNREPVHTIQNAQIGIGFGASLLTYRIRNEYLDDIIIGAPYFTSNSLENEGRVYVYKSRGILGFGLITTLKGVSFAHAQFGASLGNLGDLNHDGFNDIVVGAPYEDDGSGGIYIFNGFISGIWPVYTQHIKSRDLQKSIKGFGISFSRPEKIDNGRKTVVAVGCHTSSQAVVLQSLPVLNIRTSVQISQKSDTCQNCVSFRICFLVETQQDDSLSYAILNFTATIKQDPALMVAFVNYKGEKHEFLSTLKDSVYLASNQRRCSGQYFITVKDCCGGYEDIQTKISFELSNVTTPFVINNFQGELDKPMTPADFPYKFEYKNFCGINSNCNIAMNMSLEWEKLVNGRYFLIEPGSVSLLIKLSNLGVSINNIILYQVFPGEMFFLQAVNANSNRTLSCTIKRKEQHRDLECFFGMIEANEQIIVRLEYMIQEPKSDMSQVTIQSTVTTTTVQSNRTRLSQAYTVQTVRYVYANIKRFSRPSNFMLVNTQRVLDNRFTHVFFLSLTDPDNVENVYFLVPRLKELSTSELVIKHGTSSMECAWGNFTHTLTDVNILKYPKICEYTYCDILSCELRPKSRIIVLKALFHFTLNLQHWKPISRIVDHRYSTQICFKSRFTILGENPICRSVITEMKDVYRDELDGRVHYWFLTLAVFVGFVILVVISCFLYKCGFFKRKARQELKLKIETQKLSTARLQLLSDETSASEETDNETFVLTPFPSGSDGTQVMSPPPCYREVMQRVSNSSTECFFIYDDEDGYLQPVF